MTGCIPPSSVKFFYGRISRDDAESILKESGLQEGLHLLRESMTCAGNYALSICYQGKIHHYSIEAQPDGMVMIQDGKKFKGPVELVQHHERTLDGFLTKPSIPCERPPDVAPMAWPGVTMLELERALYEKVTSMDLKGAKLQAAMGPQRQKFIAMVAKELHNQQPWFHGKISRDEADVRMSADGHQDGKYLVRLRDDKSYALSLSIKNQTKHYKIDIHKSSTGDKLAIEDGPRFDNPMDMIAHYHNKTDGLLCKLSGPCNRPGYKRPKLERNRIYGTTAAFLDDEERLNAIVSPFLNDPVARREGIIGNAHIRDAIWDDPDNDIPDEFGRLSIKGSRSASPQISVPAPAAPQQSGSDDDTQKVYDSVPRTEDVFNLNKADLCLMERLGAGNFGSVMRGEFKRNGQKIPVAIKTLKQDDIHNAESLLMDEAKVMAGLQHRNIVRLIGVCRSDTIMLVMELAQLGPLNKFLKKHQDLPSRIVIELMFQVAEGMAYLESKNFVHRDLAARNVLLVNERFAKISDFGMSKALGLGNNYYQAETAGKWPLKWYAPECIYYFKFDSRSDVWSYGVTLWEALSYGAKPYKGLKGQQILALIEQGERLDKPARCPSGVYTVMLQCWTYVKLKRPSFKEIVESLRRHK